MFLDLVGVGGGGEGGVVDNNGMEMGVRLMCGRFFRRW